MTKASLAIRQLSKLGVFNLPNTHSCPCFLNCCSRLAKVLEGACGLNTLMSR